jgi:hypothetical protein
MTDLDTYLDDLNWGDNTCKHCGGEHPTFNMASPLADIIQILGAPLAGQCLRMWWGSYDPELTKWAQLWIAHDAMYLQINGLHPEALKRNVGIAGLICMQENVELEWPNVTIDTEYSNIE